VFRDRRHTETDQMGTKRTIRITIQQRETITVAGNNSPVLMWCQRCRSEVNMVSPELAARIASVGSREIYRRIEDGSLDFNQSPDGQLFVCLKSLFLNNAVPADE